jgi:hypothetical protein
MATPFFYPIILLVIKIKIIIYRYFLILVKYSNTTSIEINNLVSLYVQLCYNSSILVA